MPFHLTLRPSLESIHSRYSQLYHNHCCIYIQMYVHEKIFILANQVQDLLMIGVH